MDKLRFIDGLIGVVLLLIITVFGVALVIEFVEVTIYAILISGLFTMAFVTMYEFQIALRDNEFDIGILGARLFPKLFFTGFLTMLIALIV